MIGQFQLVPIIMGDQSYDACRALGVALAKLVKGTNTLIVASSDLSHYHPYDEAVKIDHKTLRAIEEFDYLSMARNFDRGVWEACGGGPIIAAMIASERLGANQAKVLNYANSGDVPAIKSRVVGYGAVALAKSPQRRRGEEALLAGARGEGRAAQDRAQIRGNRRSAGQAYDSPGRRHERARTGARRLRDVHGARASCAAASATWRLSSRCAMTCATWPRSRR